MREFPQKLNLEDMRTGGCENEAFVICGGCDSRVAIVMVVTVVGDTGGCEVIIVVVLVAATVP